MDEYLGVIKLFAGHYVPKNYVECNGQLLSCKQWDALYAILGNVYGGTEEINFNLPKMDPPYEGMRYMICVYGVFPVSNEWQ